MFRLYLGFVLEDSAVPTFWTSVAAEEFYAPWWMPTSYTRTDTALGSGWATRARPRVCACVCARMWVFVGCAVVFFDLLVCAVHCVVLCLSLSVRVCVSFWFVWYRFAPSLVPSGAVKTPEVQMPQPEAQQPLLQAHLSTYLNLEARRT